MPTVTPRALDTMQTIYTRAAQYILRQGEGSFSARGCAYRGDNGCKCAVGLFISDANYSKDLEGLIVKDVEVRAAISKTLDLKHLTFNDRGHVFGLLRRLQDAHDIAFNSGLNPDRGRTHYARQMLDIAHDFNLIPVAALNKWSED